MIDVRFDYSWTRPGRVTDIRALEQPQPLETGSDVWDRRRSLTRFADDQHRESRARSRISFRSSTDKPGQASITRADPGPMLRGRFRADICPQLARACPGSVRDLPSARAASQDARPLFGSFWPLVALPGPQHDTSRKAAEFGSIPPASTITAAGGRLSAAKSM